MTSTALSVSGPPAWPGCALGSWAAAWLGGRCAPDDVADTLAEFASEHEIADPRGTLPAGIASDPRLGLVVLARGSRGIEVRLPTAGDPQGLPPADATAAALDAGEILLLHGHHGGAATVGLVPSLAGGICRWTAFRYPSPPDNTSPDTLGHTEYELREAIREAATLITDLGSPAARYGAGDIRASMATLTARHQVILPPHQDARATRVIDSAAQVEAILALAGAHAPTFGTTARHGQEGDHQLRRLAALARAARAQAVNRVIREYLPIHG